MGYCGGEAMGGHDTGGLGAVRTARQRRRGARRRAKRATSLQASARGRAQWALLIKKVAAGTATSRERRLVGAITPTPVTIKAIEKKGGLDPGLADQMRLARRQAEQAAEQRAEAQAAALAEGEAARESADAEREQRAADADAARERRAADADAERVLRARDREEAAALSAEERQLAIEQAEYERELYAANGGAGPVFVSGGGGGGIPWRERAADDGAPPRPGLDMGAILPIAAGAALLFLGS